MSVKQTLVHYDIIYYKKWRVRRCIYRICKSANMVLKYFNLKVKPAWFDEEYFDPRFSFFPGIPVVIDNEFNWITKDSPFGIDIMKREEVA